jgi:dTDP-4-dehydrorhamnose reductase
MRILLLGKNGQIGWELNRVLPSLGEAVGLDFPEVDFTDPEGLLAVVQTEKPDVIINAAGYTAVDQAENEPEKALAINGIAPGVLAEEAASRGAGLVHYSTDYVFDGTKRTPYTEEDSPHPLNAYGNSKRAGDRAVERAGCAHLILRTSWVYGGRGGNFFLTIRRLASERPELRIVDDQVGNPTWCRWIAESTTEILSRISREDGSSFAAKMARHSGVYNLSSEGETTWFGFARVILDSDPLGKEHRAHALLPVKTTDYPTAAKRPLYSALSKEKVRTTFGIAIPSWREQFAFFLQTQAKERGQADPLRSIK